MTCYGRLAQVADASALLGAVQALHERGYTRIDVYTPYPVDGMERALGLRPSRLPAIMLAAGSVGALLILGLQYYAAVVDYPINAGGRPPASWPAFVPGVVEVGILFAVLAGVAAFLRASRLPSLYQSVFNVAWFAEASRDGFLLLLRADDPAFDPARAANDMAALHPLRHAEVAP